MLPLSKRFLHLFTEQQKQTSYKNNGQTITCIASRSNWFYFSFFLFMRCNNHFIKPLPIISFCHQTISSLNHCRTWQPYPGIMDYARKRSRNAADFDESNAFDALRSFSRPISPPRKKLCSVDVQQSPWQLTRIRDLPEVVNSDTVSLRDLLGDPLIRECWQFNFLHDIPFVMNAFDESIRHFVQLHVVHGFWKRNDLSRIVLSVGYISLCRCKHISTAHPAFPSFSLPPPPLSLSLLYFYKTCILE